MIYTKYPIMNKIFYEVIKQPLHSKYMAKLNDQIYAILLNNTASDIFELCDGKNSVGNIINVLAHKYNEKYETVNEYVIDFLKKASQANHIVFEDDLENTEIKEYGSRDYWTPEMLSIELTHKCPLKCQHCYIDAGNGDFMNEELSNKILKEIQLLNIKQIQLTGGEPLLHPDFFNIFDKLYRMDKEVQVFTSGYVFNDNIKNKLNKYKNSKQLLFQISVDGLEEYHDYFRGIEGSFNRTMNFIDYLTTLNISVIVALCMSTQKYEDLQELCSILKNKNVHLLRIGAISNQGRAMQHDLKSDAKEIGDIRSIICKLNEEFEDSTFKIQFNEDNGDNTMLDTGLNNCGMGQTLLKIAPNGDVYPCLMSNMIIGNVSNQNIKDIQLKNSRKFENIIAPCSKICEGCENLEICKTCIVQGIENASSCNECKWKEKNKKIFIDIKDDIKND